MINDISNVQHIYDVSYTPRPQLILYDISCLDVKYKSENPYIIKLSESDKEYMAEWKYKQKLLFKYICRYEPTNSEINDPDPFTDIWYIFSPNSLLNRISNNIVKPPSHLSSQHKLLSPSSRKKTKISI